MHVEEFLSQLQRHSCAPKRSGTGWTARCPAHGDRKASLSVGYGEGGRILLRCHAGCSVAAVCRALGIGVADLFDGGSSGSTSVNGSVQHSDNGTSQSVRVAAPEASVRTWERLGDLIDDLSKRFGCEPSADWSYFDANGKLTGGVLRFDVGGHKEIRPVRRTADDRWQLGALPEPRPLYRLPELLKADPTVPVIVAEGEKAADAVKRMLRAAKLSGVATTSSGGASAPHKTDWKPLAGRTVIVWPDNDEAGRKYAAAAGNILTGLGCTVKLFDPAKRFQLPSGFDAADAEVDPSLLGCSSAAEVAKSVLERAEPWASAEPTEQAVALPAPASAAPVDGAQLLNEVLGFLRRFVAYPSEHAAVAHALWVAHAHVVQAFETTPRLAVLSPEPGSGKTRCLELTATLVPNPVQASNVTPAYLFRRIGTGNCTILLDEADTVFGLKPTERSEELRALINAGHRRGAVVGRCLVRGKEVIPVEVSAFAAVALAGLRDLPDTVASRAVVVRMQRRAPGERIEPFRVREHEPLGHALRDRLAAWLAPNEEHLRNARPAMPDGLTDRPADVWESLLAVADLAGGRWPELARQAALAFLQEAREAVPQSLGVQLLNDLVSVFEGSAFLATGSILEKLTALEESPWGDMGYGRPLTARKLAGMLRQYGIEPRWNRPHRGYFRSDLERAWERYCPR